MFDEELAHKNRQHDIRLAPKRNSEVNKVIDLNEVRVTPRDHLSVPVAPAAGAPKKQAVETVLVRGTETAARCSSFFKHQLRRRGFGISQRRLSNFLQKLSRWCVTQLTNVS